MKSRITKILIRIKKAIKNSHCHLQAITVPNNKKIAKANKVHLRL